jgi:hypothetical protein
MIPTWKRENRTVIAIAIGLLVLMAWLHTLPYAKQMIQQGTELACGAPYPKCPWLEDK